jgi:DNA-binding NarL/FixJ family response regulator
MAGRRWVGRESVADVAASVKKLETMRRRAWAFGLTRRELEIVRAVVGGENNKAIASRLSISENTVKRHLTQIFNKVGVSNRIELATFAAHHRLVERR